MHPFRTCGIWLMVRGTPNAATTIGGRGRLSRLHEVANLRWAGEGYHATHMSVVRTNQLSVECSRPRWTVTGNPPEFYSSRIYCTIYILHRRIVVSILSRVCVVFGSDRCAIGVLGRLTFFPASGHGNIPPTFATSRVERLMVW